MPAYRQRGFTLIEIMITVAILAIVAAVALPSYTAYVQRARVPTALDALSVIAAKMELVYQDNNGSYGTGSTCAVPTMTAQDFAITCTPTGGGTGFVARATGSGRMANYTYSLTTSPTQNGVRATESHPKGANASCWSTKGTTCDV